MIEDEEIISKSDELLEQADHVCRQILAMPPERRKAEMDKLKERNAALWTVVKDSLTMLDAGDILGPPDLTQEELDAAKKRLKQEVEAAVPGFAEMIQKASRDHHVAREVAMHQDTFAYNYFSDEYALLGKVIKYAGMHGVKIIVMGENSK